MKVPTIDECYNLLKENKVPKEVVAHSKAVMEVSLMIYGQIKDRFDLDKEIIAAAALLHDIEKVKHNHVKLGEKYLIDKGYSEIGRIVGEHGMEYPFKSIYGKILFYADKRVRNDEIVTLPERMEYILEKYKINDEMKQVILDRCDKIVKELGIDTDKIR